LNKTFVIKSKKIKLKFNGYFELFFWTSGLILLAIMPPGPDVHYSFCVFKMMGFNFCPGCGLGHSISYLFHGDIQSSLEAHPLGPFAIVIILFRIYKLLCLKILLKNNKTNYGF
jgi:Protein of unknown function (DUF2752)